MAGIREFSDEVLSREIRLATKALATDDGTHFGSWYPREQAEEWLRKLESERNQRNEQTGQAFRYTSLYRPPSFATVPKGWTIVERPKDTQYFEKRPDLPISEHTWGVIQYQRELTKEEIRDFELRRVE